MKKSWTKVLALTMAMLIMLALVASCNTTTPSQSSTSEASQTSSESTGGDSSEEEPVKLTNADREKVTIKFSQANTNLENVKAVAEDPIINAIAEAVNVEFDIDSTTEGYWDRMQTELTAGTGPDFFPNPFFDRSVTWIKDGVVLEWGSIVNADPERWPILQKIINTPEYKLFNESYSGDPDKTYALYALAAAVNWAGATLYNKDIMVEAGYEAPPKTVDEFVDYAKNAGANGVSGWWPRNNTLTYWAELDKALFAPYGTTMMPPVGDAWQGFIPTGGKAGIEGEWTLRTTSDETKEVMKIVADLYKNKGIDIGIGTKGDFDVAKPEFFNEQIGAFNHGFSNWPQVRGFVNEAIAAAPGKTWEDYALGTLLTGPAGLGVTYSANYWMGYHWFIPENCEHPDRVLDFVEFLLSNQGQELLFYGVEGQHYTRNGDEIVYNAEEWQKQGEIYNVKDGRFKSIMFAYVVCASQERLDLENNDNWFNAATNPLIPDVEEPSEFKDYVTGIINSYKSDAAGFLPSYFPIISIPAEYSEIRTKLNEITLQYVPAFITGQKDIDKEWENYVKEYEAAGAADLEAAFNAALKDTKARYEALTP